MEALDVPLTTGGLLAHPVALTLDILACKSERDKYKAELLEQARLDMIEKEKEKRLAKEAKGAEIVEERDDGDDHILTPEEAGFTI